MNPPETIDTLVLLADPNLYDDTKEEGIFNEENFESVKKLKETLSKIPGFSFRYLDHHEKMIETLLMHPPQLVLNFCDTGYKNKAHLELNVPAFLEMLDLPYSGASPLGMVYCYDKALVRLVANDLGIPVPKEIFLPPHKEIEQVDMDFPLLLKPNFGDGSVGITKDAVVNNLKDIKTHIRFIRSLRPHTPILLQEFLCGREFSVGLIGNPSRDFHELPILEVDYSTLPSEFPAILSFESKAVPHSPYYDEIKYQRAELSKENQRFLIQSSKMLFERLFCQDYGRFDFRMDRKGQMKLLEVNPNPAWSFLGKLALMTEFSGHDSMTMFKWILNAASKRLNLNN